MPGNLGSGDRETAVGGKISGDVRLSGRVRVTEDLIVLTGAELSIAPGTVVSFDRSESSKVDPEYFFGGTELIVRGTLRADGTKFVFKNRTGGIVLDGGKAELTDCSISGAEAGITVLRDGALTAGGILSISDCRVGAALFPGGLWKGAGKAETAFEKNGIAVVRFPGAPPVPAGLRFRGSEETDVAAWETGSHPAGTGRMPHPAPMAGALRLGDAFLDTDRVISGDVVVDGMIRVAPGATLTIAPGSRLFFTFRDSDGDGIGENGIFLQGNLHAKGTAERPIGFYPLDGTGRGRWDSINFMASDRGENRLEHVEIVGAYRGLHAHFSRLAGNRIRISESYRGIQFQESEVDLSGVEVSDSLSALRCRDSDVNIEGFRVTDVVTGANFFRSRVKLSSPVFYRPGWYGIRFRDSRVELDGGEVREGLVGVSVQEGTARVEGLSVDTAALAGIALQEGDVKIVNCRVSGCTLDAFSAAKGKARFSGGAMTGFGRYAVKLTGPAEVSMSGVEVSGGRGAAGAFYDGKIVPGLGVVRVE